jgi:hypothetical protein
MILVKDAPGDQPTAWFAILSVSNPVASLIRTNIPRLCRKLLTEQIISLARTYLRRRPQRRVKQQTRDASPEGYKIDMV